MIIIAYRKIFFALSALLVIASIAAVGIFGLNLGIDFVGGSLVEISYDKQPAVSELEESVEEAGFTNVRIQPAGESSYVFRTEELNDERREEFLNAVSFGHSVEFTQERFTSIGPVIGQELQNRALAALAVVSLLIVLFVAFAFRKVSEPVSSWKYGLIAIVALLHDIIIPTGIFAVLGTFFIDYQVDVLFVTALLAILGFSVNDTIVVFDRIRENLHKDKESKSHRTFEEIVGMSVSQTYGRSLNTSLTTLFVLLALFLLGGSTTQPFALTLAIGVIAGSYSSLALAAPLLVWVESRQSKK